MSLRRAAALACAAPLVAGRPGAAAAQPAPPAPGIEVHVEGSWSRTTAPRDPTAASFVIREDRLKAPGATSSGVLSRVPGLQTARTGTGSDLATASIRGASSAETPVYLAGVRINDDITGTADLSLVPLWMLQRVEVFRGNAPADADRLGIGGAVFFEPALPRGTRVGAGLGAGSFGELSTWAAAVVGDERASAMLALNRRAASNDYPYIDDLGTVLDPSDADVPRVRPNADIESYDLWSIGRYALPEGGGVTAVVNGLLRDQGVTGLSGIPSLRARAHVQRWLGAVVAAVPCARADAFDGPRCRLELKSSALLTRQRIQDPSNRIALPAETVASAGERVAQQGTLRYRLVEPLTMWLAAAQEIERLRIDADDARRANQQRADQATTRVSAGATLDVAGVGGGLIVHALGAVERYASSAAEGGSARHLVAPSGRLGAELKLPAGLSVLANVSRYVRAPTLGERYGISSVVRGNPDLRPEQGLAAELGARLAASLPSPGADVFLELFAFSRLATDQIAFRRTGIAVIRPYNAQRARVLGLELTVGASAVDHLRAELAATVLDPRVTSVLEQDRTTLVPFQSQLVIAPYVQVYEELHGRLGLDRAALGARLLYRSPRVADPASLQILSAQGTVDLELEVLALRRRLSVRAALYNVFDARNLDVVGLALPGRSAHASVEVWW